jgi:cell division protein FtsL
VTPPAAAAVHRGRAAAPARPRVAPPRPRRISGPVRPTARPPSGRPASAAQPSARVERGLALGLLAAVSSVSRNETLDRLIRGRIWIAVIAFALIGIVTLQLLVLQLNASIGRSLVREAQLQRENAALSIEGSELAAGERVESQAARLGMELVPVGALRFLTADPRADIRRAAAALNTPVHTADTGSGEADSGSAEAGAGPAGAATAATASTASAEQTAAGEASSPTVGEAAASTPGASSTTGEAGASSSASTSSGAATPSVSAGANATVPPTETAGTGVVDGAGGVGATQTNGAG